ncbi:hypothetical protein GF343_03955 [Candidatus Woesearchaeota archaeon]|nr:hypothetical protein [Candidatus Woesearchaeota archaeon]
MKKILPILLVLSLVLLVACQQTQTTTTTTQPEKAPAPVVKKETAPKKAPEPKEEKIEAEPPKPFPKTGMKLEQVCDILLPKEKFADICEIPADQVTTTDKSSEKTCWISFTDKNNKRFTAGLTARDWENAEEANREFKRGIDMRRKEAKTDVGEKNYCYQEIERENIVWLNGRFLTHIGASTQLCTKEQLMKLAQEIDGKLE